LDLNSAIAVSFPFVGDDKCSVSVPLWFNANLPSGFLEFKANPGQTLWGNRGLIRERGWRFSCVFGVGHSFVREEGLHLVEFLLVARRAVAMAELRLGVLSDVGFHPSPVAQVVADFFAAGADG